MVSSCNRKYTCPVEATLDVIGGKYKAIIVYHLREGTLRYSEIRRKFSKITDKMLAQQLKELEADGIIIKKIYPVIPPKTEYRLTDRGLQCFEIIDAMCRFGSTIIQEQNRS
ncbi:MAG: winged helix-turn-helix transcriptional regulator [Succinivibrio sp.]